ncbi:metallophosphoesterase [Lysobacter sp. A289]
MRIVRAIGRVTPGLQPRRRAVVAALLAIGLATTAHAAEDTREVEPNTLVPAGVMRYAPSGFPDRVVSSPAQDASTGFAVAWRTNASVQAPLLEIVIAGDSPDMGVPRQVRAASQPLQTENGMAHHHRAEVDGLQPDTLYAWRVQGDRTWSAWTHLRTAAAADVPLTLLYFGDTQNKNLSLTTRVIHQALRTAPDARLALYAGDLVSGGDGEDDNEWGEWFDAGDALHSRIATAAAAGNHEFFEEYEDTPRERRVLGVPWQRHFALPRNGAPEAPDTTYWFDYQGVRVAVIDGTSVLDLDAGTAQARWLDTVLADNPHRWSIVLMHQPVWPLREGRDSAELEEHILPVLLKHRVDLVLQGHDHLYGRRAASTGDDAPATPQFVVSVAGAKQYRISDVARRDMHPIAEDSQLFQVIRISGPRLRYEARTATGRLYDAFELIDEGSDGKQLREVEEGRIGERSCPRTQTLKGRTDRCWE